MRAARRCRTTGPRPGARTASVVLLVGAAVAAALVACDRDPERVDAGGVNVADYQRDARTDSEAIQAAIDAASPGETVYFPGGVYDLDQPFRFGSGVNYAGSEDPLAVLRGTGTSSLVLEHTEDSPLHDVTMTSLVFDNVELHLTGTGSYSSVANVTVRDCVFRNGRGQTPWSSAYIVLSYTVRVTIDGCTLLRDADAPGLGIRLYRNQQAVVKDSFIGTTAELEAGTPNGYFKTAVNVFGYDADTDFRNREILVDGNVWRRAPGVDCPSDVTCEDHGLYAWGADDLVIRGNHADGWTATPAGGAMKLRNAHRVIVVDNRVMRSGIMAYTHWEDRPGGLSHVRIEGNRVDMLGNDAGTGIFYRRVDEDGSSYGRLCDGSSGEEDIFILRNRFVAGGSLDVRCAHGSEICVERNAGAHLSIHAPGVRTSGCAVPDSWRLRPAGVHRGDFNGDDREDFIHVAVSGSGDDYWRAHLSSGDGFVEQEWEYGLELTPRSERYGLHVADFDGDGRDDLAYRAACRDTEGPCWKVHHGTGAGFSAAAEFASGAPHPDETARFGVHPGDYNGDGRADLAYRGRCGGDAHPCWQVLTSQPDAGFAVQDWGDGAYWDPAQTDEYGLLVGDYNGDGRDDIAYRGRCGSTQPCLRVHLSSPGESFQAQNWGASIYADGPVTPHFGMRVVDANGDGNDDIVYRGRCGNPGEPGWRAHLGGDTYPFTISCTADLLP